MEIFDLREFDGHELIVFGHDAATSLRAIIAIHSTALGPAAGGCRMWPYATTADAVCDALRLSRGMSYKNALAGVPFGGGKAVIIGESRQAKTPQLFGLLAGAGAQLRVADVRAAAVQRVCEEFGARAVPVEEVLAEEVDVLAPCALGAVLNAQSIPRLRARIIAGAANNQLAQGQDGQALQAAGILYAPDYVINAGGIISVSRELHGGGTEEQVIADIQGIPARLTEVFERARRDKRPTNAVADQMARELLTGRRRKRVA